MQTMQAEQWLLQRRRAVALVAAGLPELGWSVSEALLVPLLKDLNAPSYLLTIAWVCSPCAGFGLQPLVGALSDRFGARRCIAVLGFVSAGGLLGIPLCGYTLSGIVGAWATLIAFGITDTGHDLLVTPTRTAINEVFDPEASEKGCAIALGVGQLLGQFCAIVCPMQYAFAVVASLLVATTLAQLGLPDPPAVSQQSMTCRADIPESNKNGQVVPKFDFPQGFVLIWMLYFAGWLSICGFSFFITGLWAELCGAKPRTAEFHYAVTEGTALCMAGGIMYTLVGYILPQIVCLCRGEVSTMILSLAAFAVVLVGCGTFDRVVNMVTIVLLQPVASVVVQNAPFAWLERQPGFSEDERGRLTGYLNTALAAAQLLIAIVGSPLVAAFNGRLMPVFYAVAVADLVVVLAAMANLCHARVRCPRQCRASDPTDVREMLPASASASRCHRFPFETVFEIEMCQKCATMDNRGS